MKRLLRLRLAMTSGKEFFSGLLFSFLLLISFSNGLWAAEAGPSDTELIEKQRDLEKDLEKRVQGILDKVFGPNQSEVKATVNLSIQKLVQKRAGAGSQAKRKEENPLGETKFILPGVPQPKNVAKDKEPDNVQKQEAEQERAQSQVSFKVNVTNRQVVCFYNEKLKPKEDEARKAVMVMTDLKEEELKFVPGKFFDSLSTIWDDFVRDPRNLLYTALLFLIFLLLIWLFVPLTNFFQNYIRAMKEKGGIEVKMESSNEEDKIGEEGKTPEELAQEALNGEGKEGEEEMKKYVPFDYINEENVKRLLGVFRKEPPQVIALVLSYLKPDLVKSIYKELPIELQTRVASESAAVRQTSEDQVKIIDSDIKAKIDFLVGGVDNLISILNDVDYKIRDNILEYLKDHKPQLYEKVRGAILMFDDIPSFPDLALQVIIRSLKTDQLARALRNTGPEILNKFLANMSQGGAALLKEEMEFGRPVTDDQIEEERQTIMEVIKKLEAEGKVQVREKKKISIFESEDATSPLTPSLPGDSSGPFPSRGNELSPARPGGGPASGGHESSSGTRETGASPAEAQSYAVYGSELYSGGNYEEALPYLQYAVQSDPNNSQTYQTLGHCYYALGMTNEALQCYEISLTLSPEDETLKAWVDQFKQSVGS